MQLIKIIYFILYNILKGYIRVNLDFGIRRFGLFNYFDPIFNFFSYEDP